VRASSCVVLDFVRIAPLCLLIRMGKWAISVAVRIGVRARLNLRPPQQCLSFQPASKRNRTHQACCIHTCTIAEGLKRNLTFNLNIRNSSDLYSGRLSSLGSVDTAVSGPCKAAPNNVQYIHMSLGYRYLLFCTGKRAKRNLPPPQQRFLRQQTRLQAFPFLHYLLWWERATPSQAKRFVPSQCREATVSLPPPSSNPAADKVVVLRNKVWSGRGKPNDVDEIFPLKEL
jgi:hypothetical protein